MEEKKCVRYGVSDIIVEPDKTPSKYARIYDENGELLGEVEVYIIGDEVCEEEQ